MSLKGKKQILLLQAESLGDSNGRTIELSAKSMN